MENSVVGMAPNPKGGQAAKSMDHLWRNRAASNEKAISMMKETEFPKIWWIWQWMLQIKAT